MCLQSVFHGFGEMLPIAKLPDSKGLHLRTVINKVIQDPNFKVTPEDLACHADQQPARLTLLTIECPFDDVCHCEA